MRIGMLQPLSVDNMETVLGQWPLPGAGRDSANIGRGDIRKAWRDPAGYPKLMLT